MLAIFSSKTRLPLLAFLSTSLLLLLAYNGTGRPQAGRFRYPDIPPPGASDSDRLRYSKCFSFQLYSFAFRAFYLRELVESCPQRTKSNT